MKFAGLGAVASATDSEDARYQVQLGANLVRNIAMSMLGLFTNGPIHLVFDGEAMMPLRMLPLASLLASFVILGAAFSLAIVHRRALADSEGKRLALAVIAGLLSLSITLPMGSVSELYGMGANVASGLLVVLALLGLWHPAQAEERRLCRAIAIAGGAVLLCVGVQGLLSRAYHFRLTWLYARQLNQVVLDHQRGLPPSPQPAVIYFDFPCYSGHFHNQYVVSPLMAMGLEETMAWMNRTNPERRVVFALNKPIGRAKERDLLLDCSDLPPRRRW
jgi:hypothetical protein